MGSEGGSNLPEGIRIPVNGGSWTGAAGNSVWVPDNDIVPGKSNPNNKTWGEIKQEFGISGIQFVNGEPDFSVPSLSKSEVKIENFSVDRYKNFHQADEAEAKKRGCDATDVKRWRGDNGYTWNERGDCETADLVPAIVHNNIVHSGGVSKKKKEMKLEGWL